MKTNLIVLIIIAGMIFSAGFIGNMGKIVISDYVNRIENIRG